jgi:hypothetical protein
MQEQGLGRHSLRVPEFDITVRLKSLEAPAVVGEGRYGRRSIIYIIITDQMAQNQVIFSIRKMSPHMIFFPSPAFVWEGRFILGVYAQHFGFRVWLLDST